MDTLRAFSLFEELSEEQAEKFGRRCRWHDYTAGEMIIDHNDDSNEVRLIQSGEVRVVVRMLEGREVILNDHGPGTFFGELAAIDGQARSANVTALTNTRMCIVPAAVFKEITLEVPEVAWNVMSKLTALVRSLSDRLSEFTFLQAKHRIFSELLRMSKERKGHEGHRIISPPPIQKDIADRVSSRREVVSREMKTLERDGILEKTRGGLVIVDVDELKRRASEGWTQ